MESWLKGVAATLGGGLALFWHPGLEVSQNAVTSALHVTGQVTVLAWLFFSFVWAFAGALGGHSLSAIPLFYLATRRSRLIHDRYAEGPG